MSLFSGHTETRRTGYTNRSLQKLAQEIGSSFGQSVKRDWSSPHQCALLSLGGGAPFKQWCARIEQANV
jgi:hypothetical protein